MKRSQPKRDWSDARLKVEREGRCRICGDLGGAWSVIEAAHILGREHDKKDGYYVKPERIVPLCRASIGGCHPSYDDHELDLLGYLTPEEEAQAVLDAGSLESARRRLAPSQYRRDAA